MPYAKKRTSSAAQRYPRKTRRVPLVPPKSSKRKSATMKKTASKKRRIGAGSIRGISKTRIPKGVPVAKHVLGQLHPFKADGSKLLDTAVSQSHAIGNRHVLTQFMNEPFYIFMMPHLQCPLMLCTTANPSMTVSTSRYMLNRASDSSMRINLSQLDSSNVDDFYHAGDILQWRTVSQGLRLELANSTSNNDGIFESWRFPGFPNAADCQYITTNGTSNTGMYFVPTFTDTIRNIVADGNGTTLVDKTGYTIGSLKDIGLHEFQLRPKTNNRLFLSIDEHYREQVGTASAAGANGVRVIDNSDRTGVLEVEGDTRLARDVYERNFDSIVIKISPGTAGSELVMHLAQNLETIYKPSSTLSRFMDHSPQDTAKQNLIQSSLAKAASAVQPMVTS